MSTHNRVIWSEGLFLQPQHLQQQERFLERFVETRCRDLVSHSWGFGEVEIERDLLAIGKLGLRRAVGVCPDGTPFRMPDDDPLPPPMDVEPQTRDMRVMFAVPLRRPGENEVDRGGSAEGLERYTLRELQARDTTSATATVAPLEVGHLRSRLLLESDVTDAYACIPVAHIVESRADKQVVLDESFIPTVLQSRAAPRLATLMTEVLGLVRQRGDALSGRVSATGRGSAAEIASFLMLQAINRVEPQLAHHLDGGLPHPERLYDVYASLAGELATFTAVSRRPSKLAGYRHDRLKESFEPVIAALRSALSVVLEQAAIAIPIEPRRFGISVAVVADRTLFSGAAFVLAARADVPAEDLRRRFPTQLKVGPVEKIRDLVTLQLPGVPVRPLPVAPRQIPFHAGFAYFELDQTSDLWEQLAASAGVALHVAGEFPGLTMEFWAIRG
jgi:type VI secretion system protein ImpJ